MCARRFSSCSWGHVGHTSNVCGSRPVCLLCENNNRKGYVPFPLSIMRQARRATRLLQYPLPLSSASLGSFNCLLEIVADTRGKHRRHKFRLCNQKPALIFVCVPPSRQGYVAVAQHLTTWGGAMMCHVFCACLAPGLCLCPSLCPDGTLLLECPRGQKALGGRGGRPCRPACGVLFYTT
jgi:hypothetical protein